MELEERLEDLFDKHFELLSENMAGITNGCWEVMKQDIIKAVCEEEGHVPKTRAWYKWDKTRQTEYEKRCIRCGEGM